MFRGNVESWYSRADDSNPFFEDENRSEEYTSTCSRITFKLFRFICLVVLYFMLGWSVLFVILSLYGLAHYNSFADAIQPCVDDWDVPGDATFRHHHSVRLVVLMIYGLSCTAFTLTASRAPKFSVAVKVCLLGLGLIISLASLTGDILELVWPFTFDSQCSLDWYVVWLYRGWPWYTATLVLFALFSVVKYFEHKYFIIERS